MSESKLKTGMNAPDFSIPDQNEKPITLKSLKGKWVVLYFYPKDNTSGCSMEAQDFTAQIDAFNQLNAVVLGVSPDSPKSHQNFIAKKMLNFTLLSDPEHTALEAYGVWQKKLMYGREYFGVVRSTFLIHPNGKIEAIWDKVKVKGHVSDVLAKLKELQGC